VLAILPIRDDNGGKVIEYVTERDCPNFRSQVGDVFEVSAVNSSSVPPILALLAQPVGGNPTQYLVEKAFAHHDLDWRYLSFEVGAEGLPEAMRGLKVLGFYGGHLGDPHKQTVIPLLDRTTETAAAVGAVNVFYRRGDALEGDNLEGKGVLQAIRRIADPAGKRCILLGAGKIARATALELAAAGAGGITIVNRDESRANELLGLLAAKCQVPVSVVQWQGEYAVPAEADVLIHTTSIGRQDGNALVPLLYDSLRPELLVADVSTDPPQTRLLHEAAGRGCKTVDGLSIFIEQVALAVKLWTGVDPDRDVLRDAVEEYLEV
jgi:shikimate dehydrogenase